MSEELTNANEMTAAELLEQVVTKALEDTRGTSTVHIRTKTNVGDMYFAITVIGQQEEFDEYQKVWEEITSLLEPRKGKLN